MTGWPEQTLLEVADVYIPAPNRPKLVDCPALVIWNEVYPKSIVS